MGRKETPAGAQFYRGAHRFAFDPNHPGLHQGFQVHGGEGRTRGVLIYSRFDQEKTDQGAQLRFIFGAVKDEGDIVSRKRLEILVSQGATDAGFRKIRRFERVAKTTIVGFHGEAKRAVYRIFRNLFAQGAAPPPEAPRLGAAVVDVENIPFRAVAPGLESPGEEIGAASMALLSLFPLLAPIVKN
jgi:hypothetical protein